MVLSETAVFAYKVDNYYNPEADRGLAYNDETLNIDWKLSFEDLKLSAKDLIQPKFKDAPYFEHYKKLYV